jgi:hypothetical protein
VLGRPLPAAWREYLCSPSWLREGWLESGCYLRLHPPLETVDMHSAWQPATSGHPGIAVIGGDGARERLVLDLRRDPVPVLAVHVTSEGWDEAVPQAGDVGEFVERVAAGTFTFAPG